MFKWTRLEINELADEANFNKNVTEKVLRLLVVLKQLDEYELGQCLALKGGTAINLFLLDLPRLSVDIDLDFTLPIEREPMLEKRKNIDRTIRRCMANDGYVLSDRSKFTHSLDSYVYDYTTLSGSKDVLKIEINYSNRVHVLKPQRHESTKRLGYAISAMRLANEELIGSKISALLSRTTPRDVYDVYALHLRGNHFDSALIRKIALLYTCLSSEIPVNFKQTVEQADLIIRNMTFQRIKATLFPVLHKGVHFDADAMKNNVSSELKTLLNIDDNDTGFINAFNQREFRPDLLFKGFEIEDIKNHPMARWKMKECNR